MTDAEQGEEREEERRDSGCQEERDRKARGGDQSSRAGETEEKRGKE